MKILFTLSLSFLYAFSSGQGTSSQWILGYDTIQGSFTGRTQIDFFTGIPIIQQTNNRYLSFIRANAAICDSLGNLIFYTNGFFIVNNNNDTLLNGAYIDTSIVLNSWINIGSPIPQSVFIIPRPGIADQYYLFHETVQIADVPGISQIQPLAIFYSLIDMTADSGNGAVIERQVTAISDTMFAGGITGVKHANGRDWWIINHENNSNGFYTLLVTPDSIAGPYIQYIGQQLNYGGNGQCVFSPDGSHFAIHDNLNDLDVFDFDRCTGLLSNYRHVTINDSAGAAGVAFSPNSQYIYVSRDRYLYQFDINVINLASSQITVAVWDTFYSPNPPFATTFYLAQLAPDGKIYICNSNSTYRLHVINSPDLPGLACDVCQHCISLPTYNAFTIPNHPNYFLGADSTSICDSLTSSIDEYKFDSKGTLIISPNPATNFIKLNVLKVQGTTATINIYNSLGELIGSRSIKLNAGYATQDIYIGNISNGIYIVRMEVDNDFYIVRFVKE